MLYRLETSFKNNIYTPNTILNLPKSNLNIKTPAEKYLQKSNIFSYLYCQNNYIRHTFKLHRLFFSFFFTYFDLSNKYTRRIIIKKANTAKFTNIFYHNSAILALQHKKLNNNY